MAMSLPGLKAIRGAIAPVENSRDGILSAAKTLLAAIIHANNLEQSELTAVVFTATPDLDTAYPAEGIRDMGLTAVPMLCVAEMPVQGSMPQTLRAMVFISGEVDSPRHVYMGEAKKLRPDWSALDE